MWTRVWPNALILANACISASKPRLQTSSTTPILPRRHLTSARRPALASCKPHCPRAREATAPDKWPSGWIFRAVLQFTWSLKPNSGWLFLKEKATSPQCVTLQQSENRYRELGQRVEDLGGQAAFNRLCRRRVLG